MKRGGFYFIILVLIFSGMKNSALNAEGQPPPVDTPLFAGKKEGDKSYVLQSGDRVQVRIYPEDPFIKGGEMQISSDGNITLPLVGRVQIVGKSVNEAERLLAGKIDQDYIVNPEVVITVMHFKEKNVVLLGEVRKPGTYSFPPGAAKMSLLEAVSQAGGFSDIANIKKIKIIRKAGSGEKKAQTLPEDRQGKREAKEVIHANAEAIISGKDEDVSLEPGDVIHVSESLF